MRRHVLLAATVLAVGLVAALEGRADTPNRRPTDEERGEELYARHCVHCHGERAAGDGPATRALVHPVPDLRGRVSVDDASVEIVARGRGAMPSFEESFDRADARRVLQHMLSLSTRADAPADAGDAPADAATTESTDEAGR